VFYKNEHLPVKVYNKKNNPCTNLEKMRRRDHYRGNHRGNNHKNGEPLNSKLQNIHEL
jgi:hypothetical protein